MSADVAVLTAQIAASHSGDVCSYDQSSVVASCCRRVPERHADFHRDGSRSDWLGKDCGISHSASAAAGHLTDVQPGHTDDFDSTSNSATYTVNADARGTDNVTATAVYISGQDRIPIGTKDATVTITNTYYTLFGGPGG